jgi:Leucine-rich repeat (LRR) protein
MGCLDKEMESLLAFKSGLHDPAGCLVSWNVSFSCYQWKGVSWDRRTGHIVAVDLHNCNLSGAFHPEQLFELRDLESLNVSSNNFTGQRIPRELGLLKKLTYLNLSTAGFAGTIPWQLGNLSSLKVLDLSASEPSMLASHDLSWFTNFTALEHLAVNRVDLSATSSSWGQSVSHLSQLRNLSMSNCGLTGSIPASLQNLASLQIFHLDGNTFHTEFPSWIGNMTSLVSLQMSNAYLNGSLASESLSRLPNLKRIYLGNNKISANVSQIFQGQWKSLTLFQMPNNRLYGSIPYSIGNLSSLAQLQLQSNMLKGTIPESLGRLRSLTVLDLGYNRLTGPIPSS